MADTLHAQNWCDHKGSIQSSDTVWIIEHFSHCSEKFGEVIESSLFSSIEDKSTQWKLKLYPFGFSQNNGFLSLYLHLDSTNQSFVRAKYSVSIIDSKGNKVISHIKETPLKFTKGDMLGEESFIRRSDLLSDKDLLINDVLKIYCEIEVLYEQTRLSGKGLLKTFQMKEDFEDNMEDFLTLLESGMLSDACLVSDEKEIKVHKSILSAKSTVFLSMFSHDMLEKNTNKVTITDVSYETLRDLMKFIYGGIIPVFGKKSQNLLKAADKYDVKTLKWKVESQMRENIDPTNACELLALADSCDLSDTKQLLMQYIFLENFDAISKTSGWKCLKESKDLFCECFEYLLESHHCFKLDIFCPKKE